MAQHSNYAKDRDLMMEAYGSVEGIIPPTQSTAPARLYTESHCSDEEQLESIEIGGKLYEVGNDDPNDDGLVIKIEKHPNGYFITGGVYSEPEDFVNDPENPREGYGYALTLDGQPMDEDDLEDGLGHSEDAEHSPIETAVAAIDALAAGGSDVEALTSAIDQLAAGGGDKVAAYEDLRDYMKGSLSQHGSYEDLNDYLNASLGHSEDAETRLGATNEFPDGEGKYEVVSIGGMHGQSKMGGEKFNSLADACAHAGIDPSEITSEEWIDMEGDGTTLEFMVDEDTAIVMHKNVPAEDSSCMSDEEHEDAEDAAGGDFDHSVVFQLEGPLSMGVTPLERDVNQADAGLASRHEREEANGMVLVSDEDGKCILFYNGEELDQDGLEAAVRAFDAEDGEHVPAEDSSCASHSDEEEDEEVVAESYTAAYLERI